MTVMDNCFLDEASNVIFSTIVQCRVRCWGMKAKSRVGYVRQRQTKPPFEELHYSEIDSYISAIFLSFSWREINSSLLMICHLFHMRIILCIKAASTELSTAVTFKCRITAWAAYGCNLLNIQNMKRALYKIRTYRALNIVSWCLFFLRFYWDSPWLYSSRSKKPRRGLLSLQIW